MSLIDPSPNPICDGNLTGIRRLDLRSDPQEIPWDDVHEQIQAILEVLTRQLKQEVPELKWKAGRSSGGVVSLFSYRAYYHLDGDDHDPIIVGLTFVESGPNIRISGDISGDESGYIYYEDDKSEQIVSGDLVSIQEVAASMTRQLSTQNEIVRQAIQTRHRRAIAR